MSSQNDDPVTVSDLTLHVETDAALGVIADGEEDVIWLPKSQLEEHTLTEIGSKGMAVMPQWLADKKGLDYA